MKIALCHLELSCGPQARNLRLLAQAVRLAGEQGANWVLTPETAVQGYYFRRIDAAAPLMEQPAAALAELRALCRQYALYLFLGCGEYVAQDGKNYNSCLVFGPDGRLCGRQPKNFQAGSAESWASTYDQLTPVNCGGVRVGVLVCADSWFSKNPLALKEQGAEILVDIAAWPPTECCGDPLPSWQAVAQKTGLPFILCNQTGKTEWMDMTLGQSVVIEAGTVKAAYSGKQAVLLCDYDLAARRVLSQGFTVVPLSEGGQ